MGDKTPVLISDDKGVNEHDEGLNELTVVIKEKKKDDDLEVNCLTGFLMDGSWKSIALKMES
jgi:hypothetical protein